MRVTPDVMVARVTVANSRIGFIAGPSQWRGRHDQIVPGFPVLVLFGPSKLKILVGVEPCQDRGIGLHWSMSHPGRYPTWDEIMDARDALFGPERVFQQELAKRSEWVNLHSNCFHFWGDVESEER